MVALTVLRQATRAGPARLVAGMRVSLASSSASSSFARSMVSKMSLNTMGTVGARAFSGSASRFGSGTTDVTLAQKLQEELKYEQDAAEVTETTPEFLKNFLEKGIWSIDDVRGNDEVTIVRKFGDENIRVIFSIADIQTEEDFEEESEAAESDVEDPAPYPIRASVSITKSNSPGALNLDLMCQEGHFIIENISFYEDTKLGTELTAEADWKRRGLYIGPPFDTLDVSLQDEFERFLQERGVDGHVATFIPEYAAHKEQQEYVRWLGKVKNFVDV